MSDRKILQTTENEKLFEEKYMKIQVVNSMHLLNKPLTDEIRLNLE
jgi:hypothetical protein